MPIELHTNATRPLDDGIFADRIIERRDQNIGAVDLRRMDSILQIGHEIARTFHSERIRYGRFESENRHASHGRQHELRHCLARSRSHREDPLLGRRPAESGHQAGHELVEVFRLYIHMRVVSYVRADSKVGISRRCRRATNAATMTINSRVRGDAPSEIVSYCASRDSCLCSRRRRQKAQQRQPIPPAEL